MKKVIGILSVSTLALAMFLNTNLVSSPNNNFNLASLTTLNTANAEINTDGEVEDVVGCTYTIDLGFDIYGVHLGYSTEMDGTRTECVSGPGSCWTTGLCF